MGEETARCRKTMLAGKTPAGEQTYRRCGLDDGHPPPCAPGKPCRGCGACLIGEHWGMADGCPCNSGRGVNHGLVPVEVCTCAECDPTQRGFSRYGRPSPTPDRGPGR